jgi:hypothetical protein
MDTVFTAAMADQHIRYGLQVLAWRAAKVNPMVALRYE